MTAKKAWVLVLVLLAATLTGGVSGVAAQDSTSCSTTVVHDAFRFDNQTVTAAVNTSAASNVQNTLVNVTQSTVFVKLTAENPNGYCVKYTVEIADDVVSPAELGNVEANSENATASWHAIRDFQREETYTAVSFTLQPGETATFSPSKVRVKSLAWSGHAKSTAGRYLGNYSKYIPDIDIFGDDELEQRTYSFTPENNSSIVTISLRNASDGRSIKEWQASYRTKKTDYWQQVDQDSSKAVFYRRIDDHRVQFIFNKPDAKVRFTANPTTWEKAQFSYREYTSGIRIWKNIVPDILSTLTPLPTGGDGL